MLNKRDEIGAGLYFGDCTRASQYRPDENLLTKFRVSTSVKTMPKFFEFELGKSADIITRELLKLKSKETFIVTADTESDPRVVEAIAGAAFTIGAKPMVIWLASPLGVGKAADPMLPIEALAAVLMKGDAWVELNNKWLLYSTPYYMAMESNKKLRHLCLPGMNVSMMIRCIGRINFSVLREFQNKITNITQKAKTVHITTPAGTDVTFENVPGRPFRNHTGHADTPGSHMLSGQISWTPKFESINGIIVFDGSLVPVGMLREPVRLEVKGGKIERVEGGKEAAEFEAWLRGLNDPNMFLMAHISYGFNPGARLSGDVLEDERIWGCTEWGIGAVGPYLVPPEGRFAASHSDGISLNSSVWLDGIQALDKGKVTHSELTDLARQLANK